MMIADDAYNRHIEMWTAMQKELGDNPTYGQRVMFKMRWCADRDEKIECNCYLCQYDREQYGKNFIRECCDRCLVDWGTVYNGNYKLNGCCDGKTKYATSPISEILKLPRRENINNDC